MPLAWKVDECSVYFERLHVRGWCFQAGLKILAVTAIFPDGTTLPVRSFGQPSPDVAATHDPAATHCRFDEWLTPPPELLGRDFILRFAFADGSTCDGGSVIANANAGDAFHTCWANFLALLHALPAGGSVLEIGSRARSAITRRDVVPAHLNYVGLDILAGPNVDVVGDAHELERVFGRNRFVAAFSFSVFEHLAMPWKVALELNHVLVTGGLVFTQTHHTWPLHEEPWDFWRFSRHSWQALFNAATGFEVVEAACGEPARIHALKANPVTRLLAAEPSFLGSDAIVRKISDTALTWPVDLRTAARDMYPAGELSAPPS